MRFEQVYNWIEVNKPEIILEVGTWDGQSALRMMREGGKKYIGFDLWNEGDEVIDVLENNVKKHVTFEEITETLKDIDAELIMGNTRDTLPEYVKDKKPFVDLAVIDGGHSKGTIKNDLLQLLNIMKTNGVIFLDDYYFGCPTSNLGAQEVLRDLNLPFTVLPKMGKAVDRESKVPYIIKMARIDMKDVPRPSQWEAPASAWQFKPEAA